MKRSITSILSLFLALPLMAGAMSCSDEKDAITGADGGTGGSTSGTGGATTGSGGTTAGSGGARGGSGGTTAGTGGSVGTDAGTDATTDTPVPTPLWSAAKAKSLSAQETSGFIAGPASCTNYTLVIATKAFTASDCSATVPRVSRTLTDAEFGTVDAAMAKLKVTTQTNCGADKGVLEIRVKGNDGTETWFRDSFYACQAGGGIFVDNIDSPIAALRALAN
ncbi:MAG TPA: hypothetical protein VNO55_10075 [Polyangia bacterium]|nr:hypothetical protein [Polyangia bacterium]